MKKQLLFLAIFSLVFVFSSALVTAAVMVQIDVNDFKLNETLAFDYQIVSDVKELIGFFSRIECPTLANLAVEIRTVDLNAGIPFKQKQLGSIVDESVAPQTCTAIVKIISPTVQVFDKNFEIKTAPVFDFSILLCEDSACSKKSKVFLKTSQVFLNFEAPQGVKATALLTTPSGNKQTFDLPSSFTPTETGTFKLEVTAENSRKITKSTEFYVVETQAQVVSKSVCNANGACDAGENYQNCPQDCKKPALPSIEGKAAPDNLVIISGISAAAIIIIFLFFAVRHFRKKYRA